jgi:large subunit ribosomal protein L1
MFSLPFSTLKKEFKVAVFSRDNTAQYGADRVGAEDLIEEIQKGKIEYDCYMSTEEMAPVIAKLAKILGPRGLFPTKKTNTINDNPAATIQTFKRGVLKYTANNNIIHAKIAHIKMSNKEITDNIFGLIKDISSISLKKTKEIIKSVYISSTMGHSVKIPCSLILD